MTDQADEARLDQWCTQVTQALELDELNIDIHAVLGLAGQAAHSASRPAAPLTTFIAGYAAGMAAATTDADSDSAMKNAISAALQLAHDEQERSTGSPLNPHE